jgi:hypothetical protein
MRFTRTITLLIAGLISGLASAADTTDERTYRAPDGSILKLIENGLMTYESWSGGQMCFLRGQLPDTPKTRKTQEFSFVVNDAPTCTGKLKFLDPDGDTLTFYTNGQCTAMCGARNPPPKAPLGFSAN